MTIGTYAELNTAVANWMSRSDLTSRIPEGIQLCEAKMNRFIRSRDMVTKNAAFSVSAEYVALPTNFAEMRTFYLNTSIKQVLTFMPDDTQTDLFGSGTGMPKFYSIQGSNFRFAKPPDQAYSATLVYLLKVPALTSGATTNWVITSHPDAYLYGVNAEMCGLMNDDVGQTKWDARFYNVMAEINADAKRSRWGGNGMAVRVG